MVEVMVLHAELTGQGDPLGQDALIRRLPYAYRLDLERRSVADRAASLEGVRLLCEGVMRLRRTALDVSRLHRPDGGKPTLAGGPWFSISHSAQRVAVAVSDGCDLGVDLEDLGAHGRDRTALERWTAIEATLKAVGAGLRQSREVRLSLDLAKGEVAGHVVHTYPLLLSPGCVARLATLTPVARLVVEEWGKQTADSG